MFFISMMCKLQNMLMPNILATSAVILTRGDLLLKHPKIQMMDSIFYIKLKTYQIRQTNKNGCSDVFCHIFV